LQPSLGPAPALSANEFKPFKVAKIEKLSHDTNKYVFTTPDPRQDLGMHVAGLLLVKAEIDGELGELL
jgi:Oxidoreductase FAD-binding domain